MPKNSKYSNVSASTLIKTGSGTLYGIVVNSNTGGSFKVWDNTSAASTVVFNTFTPTTATSQVYLFPMGISFYTGLYLTVGGTADITVLYE